MCTDTTLLPLTFTYQIQLLIKSIKLKSISTLSPLVVKDNTMNSQIPAH